MTPTEAKELSHLLSRIGSHLSQSVEYVKDHDTPKNYEEYLVVVGKLMGDLFLDAMMPLYQRYPELKPDYLDGPYIIPYSAYMPNFYGFDTGASKSIKELKAESGRGDGIAPVTPPTPPDMRVRIRRFLSDDGDRP